MYTVETASKSALAATSPEKGKLPPTIEEAKEKDE